MENFEKKFYNALKKIFIGVKIEGQGGYVNLAAIKSDYYLDIEKILKDDIEKEVQSYPPFKEEMYDKLYTFFNKYFTESGSIYFNYTTLQENIYEKIYNNNKDVKLFWKTHMLYYVKSEILYKSLEVKVDELTFFVDATEIELTKNNEKKELVFNFKEVNNGIINLVAEYSQRNKKTDITAIIKKLSKENILVEEEQILKVIRAFKSQTEVDYFINKNATAFLKEQFDLWLYQYMFKEMDNNFSEVRVAQLKSLKRVAFNVIDFIAQFEDELVKIWNKPKFARSVNYVIPLTEIKNLANDLLNEMMRSESFELQLEEWKESGYINAPEDIYLDKNNNLPIDTKYFKQFELKLLNRLNINDENTNGLLIKSDNYQALNTLKNKYKGKVKCIYIDPPYNTEDDDFIYKDKLKHSSWLTMMHNRLELAYELLSDDGALMCQIDYKELHNLKHLLEAIFGEENFVQLISVKTSSPAGFKTVNPGPIDVTEYILFVTKNKKKFNFKKMYTKVGYDSNYNLYITNKSEHPEKWKFTSVIDKFYEENGIKDNEDAKQKWGKNYKQIRDLLIGDFALEHAEYIVSKRDPHKPSDKVRQLLKESKKVENVLYEERPGNNPLYIYKGGALSFYSNKVKNLDGELTPTELLTDFWNDISWAGIAREGNVELKNGKKPERLIKRIIDMTTDKEGDLVMDFFSGSGTTISVAHKMNRKWIGIEFGEYFETKTLQRLKNVVCGEKTGVSKIVGWNGGGIFKYYSLEQYEDVLSNSIYNNSNLTIFNAKKSPYEQYIFLRDRKLALEFEDDFVDFTKIYSDISIAETLSNLFGQKIVAFNEDGSIKYEKIKIKPNEVNLNDVKQLIWW